MFLCIDTSLHDVCTLTVFDEDSSHVYAYHGTNRDLLSYIDTAVRQQHLTPADIRGIVVVVGAGSFTGTRIATTIANTCAYVNHIPVRAISQEQAKDLQACIAELVSTPSGHYISASYSSTPTLHTS